MLHIALIDDSELQLEISRQIVEDCLEQYSLAGEVSCFSAGMDLYKAVKQGTLFDLFIMDIIMPDISGIELASHLRNMGANGHIVFLSSSQEYAVQSYDVKASYYLLKPIDREKFMRVLSSNLLELTEQQRDERISVNAESGVVQIRRDEILYVMADDRRPCYVLTGGRRVRGKALRGKFRDAVAPLLQDPRFTECGLSCVVRLSAIDAADETGLLLRDGSTLYLSGTAASEIRKKPQR